MVKLLKVHGSQNHFFILDQTELDKPLTDEELRDFTKKITNAQQFKRKDEKKNCRNRSK